MRVIDLNIYKLAKLLNLSYTELYGILISYLMGLPNNTPIDYSAVLYRCREYSYNGASNKIV